MRFAVSHETLYRYAKPVWLTSHVLRLTPRSPCLSRALVVEPEPARRREEVDGFGNLVTHVDFVGATDVLRIVSRFELETRAPPALPARELALYLIEPRPDDSVHAFAAALAREPGSPPAFLDRLNRTLFTDFSRNIRDVGAARTPAQTLALREGACRDLTVLFLAACRSRGLPARFVSGYQSEAQTPDGRRHLHAWAEVYLPGGWRGYDPTHGLTVTDGHVALCAAPDQAATMPVEGGYWGEAVGCELSYEVRIDAG